LCLTFEMDNSWLLAMPEKSAFLGMNAVGIPSDSKLEFRLASYRNVNLGNAKNTSFVTI